MKGRKIQDPQCATIASVSSRLAAAAILFTTAAVLLIDCGKGTNSKSEPGYLLYAAMHGPTEGWIAVIDCATDSVIDSVTHGFQTGPGVVVSPNGKYFAVLGSNRPPEIFDAVTRSQIKYLTAPSIGVLFIPSHNVILSPGYNGTRVYQIPGFDQKEEWPRPRWFTEPVGRLGMFATIDSRGGQPPRDDLFKLLILTAEGAPVDSLVIKQGETALTIGMFTFSQDGSRFYGWLYGVAGGPYLAGYDLSSRTFIFLQPTNHTLQHCRLSPDGLELWATAHGSLNGLGNTPGGIFIFDALTGAIKDSVSVSGYYSDSTRTLAPSSIRFLPNSEKVYINCVAGNQPILIVNRRTKKVENLIFRNLDMWPEEIDLAPRP